MPFSHIQPGCDIYISKTCQRHCVSSERSKFNTLPIVHAVRHNPAVSRNILTKWQPPIWLGYRRAAVSSWAPNTVTAKHEFISKSSVVLLLINTTTLQFSVSFSFNKNIWTSNNERSINRRLLSSKETFNDSTQWHLNAVVLLC